MDPGGGSSKSGKKDAESLPSSKAATSPTDKSKISTKLTPSSKGVENAKKRLRAFSIQKKAAITPIVVPKPSSSSSNTTTVIIGKLTGVKVTPKIEPDPELKKLKPPKPGASRRAIQDSYVEVQKRTLSEIEDMKRKMELVDLGIPLGLICPTSTNEKAMPTKAMPPIKSLLDPAKVDELIREAKKAKQEGREFKFDYQKLLPDYDNPFQKKKDEPLSQPTYEKERRSERRRSESERDRDRRRTEKYDIKRHDYKKDIKYKDRRYDDSQRENTDEKETDVNLNDYLVCDSWSLENDDKNSTSSPRVSDKPANPLPPLPTAPIPEQKIPLPPAPKTPTVKITETLKTSAVDSPKTSAAVPTKIEKLQPVMDSFKFEIDPNDDEILDIFDEDSDLNKYAQETKAKLTYDYYDSPNKSIVDYDQDNENSSMDGINDDTFLESVIREIKQENLSDEESQDRGLVEYDMSPNKEESPEIRSRSSVTPEMDEKMMNQSQRGDYSEGYRSDSYKSVDTVESGYKSVESGYKSVESGYKSVESGYKSVESGYKSVESEYKSVESEYKSEESEYKSVDSFRLSVEKELDEALEAKMSKSTVDSLETWSFVLKICQPLLFRHDKNKCYKETRTTPTLWFAENPKACSCVKDRGVVYDELEMCKMGLVDRVYGCDQIPDAPCPKTRKWYPRNSLYSTENTSMPLSSEWESEDSQLAERSDMGSNCTTPLRNDEMSLDLEYQRFMEAVWPDVVESKADTSRSTTPVRQESRKKKKELPEKDTEEKKPKKIKLSSEGWSQESDVEEEDKGKKLKMGKEKVKSRKRKHSTSTLSSVSESDDEDKKKRKLLKKKAIKKAKSKSAKRRRVGRKLLKKLKEKQKKRSKEKETEEVDSDKKKEKKLKKKKQQKLKKKELKKKKIEAQSSSSSSSSSDSSDSESDGDRKVKKAKKKALEGKKKVKKLRKLSTSDSNQSEELFDVNILNNIKTERLTDDEIVGHKMMDFSPRRQKPREIINVKELQNDFVGNVHIKQEVIEDIPEPESPSPKELFKLKDSPKEPLKEEVTKVSVNEDSLDSKVDVAKIEMPKVSPQSVKMPHVSPAPSLPSPIVPQTVPVPAVPQTVPVPAVPKTVPVPAVSQTVPVPAVPVHTVPVPIPVLDESNMSQGSSQESICSIKDAPIFYEKDESHLRPSSQNSNYSFNDVINASQNNLYQKDIKTITANQNSLYDKEIEVKVDQSLYPKEIETISSQSSYTKTSASPSDYSKIPAIQSDYSKIPASQSDYNNKLPSSQRDYSEISASQSDYSKPSASQSDYSKISTIQSDYSKISTIQSDYSKISAIQSDYSKPPVSQSDYSKIPASQSDYSKISASQSDYGKRIEVTTSENSLYDKDLEVETECDDKYGESYEAPNYEMYEQMAMAYQSDVASQQRSSGEAATVATGEVESQRIETVVGARTHGEIKCDWRAGDAPTTPHRSQRPSRWGLKPGEVNIVLTGGGSRFQRDAAEAEPVYRIQSLANRTDISTGYDEAYMDMYGAADRLQYGDCFSDDIEVDANLTPISPNIPDASGTTRVPGNAHISPNIVPIAANITPVPKEPKTSALDERIFRALQETVLGGIAKELDGDKDTSDKEKSVTSAPSRAVKRVSFADGYKPGQDSDVEEPPAKKRKRPRRLGCAWPCPASHPDHVPLWDALPPPPPPPGSPPPPRRAAPPVHLLRAARRHATILTLPAPPAKFDPPVPLPGFMPPEPPPGLIALQ
ncbi:calponin homology domain-containing protein DDB_G0272472-like isoform X2 [Maniola jurtina]|uniref:calponin homology domain-containing protein DDB_G0272472-like isoform X2 n=1 Tax=Maniola jurtina TaxID=191418 RepID=UPI001E686DAF|nr:calponin homology domain-containing protein DDB_G0272472-like isoform X2 [Maniola jurtina]